MNNRNPAWFHAKHPYHHGNSSDFNQVYSSTLIDSMPNRVDYTPPSYSNIYMASEERFSPETHKKVKIADYKGTSEYTKNGNLKVYVEDVDNEAEEFIKLEHKKFELSKWMSMSMSMPVNED